MHTTLWVSMSTNGMIADKNGEEEFLSDAIWELFVAQIKSTKSVIIGRKAYEGLLKWPVKYINQMTGVIVVVITTNPGLSLFKNWRVARSPEEALAQLDKLGITHTTVSGGATTNSSFLEKNLVSDVIYAVDPVIKGEGIPPFMPIKLEKSLKLNAVEEFNGIAILKYNLT